LKEKFLDDERRRSLAERTSALHSLVARTYGPVHLRLTKGTIHATFSILYGHFVTPDAKVFY
jgi:hypothetical protein